MSDRSGWVDEVCRGLQVQPSPWLPWSRRERHQDLGREGGCPGVYVLAWGADEKHVDVIHLGEASDLSERLAQLEGAVKWRQRPGYEGLRNRLEQLGDHQVMSRVWVKIIRIDEPPLFESGALSGKRIEALGAKRRHLEAILTAEHQRRSAAPAAAPRRVEAPFASDADRLGQQAAA